MANCFLQIRQASQSTIHLLLVFTSLLIAFGLLSSHQSSLWQAFLPILSMGLSYGMMTLSLDQLFREDCKDGTLEWIMSTHKPLEHYVGMKILTHWARLGIPVVGLVGLVSGFSSLALLWSIGITTLTLTLLGAMSSALCLNIKTQGALLPPLLTLPLGIPMMVASMVVTIDSHGVIFPYLTIQAGLFLMACALSFMVCPFALRLSVK